MGGDAESRDLARRLVRALIDAYNRKDLAGVTELYDPDVRLWTSLGEETTGRDAVAEHLRRLFRELPDEQMEADAIVTDGDTVVVELTSRGTGSDGAPYRICFTEVIELSDGWITEIRTYIDPDEVAAATA